MSLSLRSPAINTGETLPEIARAMAAVKATLDVREGRMKGRSEARFVEKGEVDLLVAEATASATPTIQEVMDTSTGTGPNAPTSFAVTEGTGGNKAVLSWTNPSDDDLWAIEIIVNTSNDRPTGQSIFVTIPSGENGESFTFEHIHGEPTADHYYWIRALDYAMNPSEWVPNASTSTYLTQGQDTINEAVSAMIDILSCGTPPAYDGGETYTSGDIVTNSGTHYQCYNGPISGVEPGVTAGWDTYWRVTGILVQGNVDGVSTVGVNGNLVVDGTLLARAIAANTITANEINTGSISLGDWGGSLDDIADGTTYGKIRGTQIDASGIVLLSAVSGDSDDISEGTSNFFAGVSGADFRKAVDTLDDISDGANYGRVDIASLTAGGLVLLSQVSGDLDDIADGTYGKVLSTDISAGHIRLSECTGDLDDIDDGTYGKVLSTDISAGHILLTGCSGDLDDITDGTNFGKVSLTSISGGQIILSGCSGDADDISEGGTNKFAAESGAVKNFSSLTDDGGTLTISTSKLQISTNAGMEVTANISGGIKLKQGADITMEAALGSPSMIDWKGDALNIYQGVDFSCANLGFWPSTANNGCVGFGWDSENSAVKRLETFSAEATFSYIYGYAVNVVSSATGDVDLEAGSNIDMDADGTVLIDPASSTSDRLTVRGNNNNDIYIDNQLILRFESAATLYPSYGVSLYKHVTAGELIGMDSSGNKTTLTPHRFELFEPDESYEFPWSYFSENYCIGKRLNADLYGAVKAIEGLTGKQFIYVEDIPESEMDDWDEKQAEMAARQQKKIDELEAKKQTLRDQLENKDIKNPRTQARLNEKLSKLEKKTIQPYTPQEMPDWMQKIRNRRKPGEIKT